MKQATIELIESVRAAVWFGHVGEPLPAPSDAHVLQVATWAEAANACSSVEWENVALEHQNRLTMALHANHRERYRAWNNSAVAVRNAIDPIIEEKTRAVVAEHDLPKQFTGSIQWDLLSACMESEYSDLIPPGFFAMIVEWYRQGRFPCGWGSRDENGRLRLVGPEEPSFSLERALSFPVGASVLPIPEGRLIVF
jgi:hypothetical protein